MREIMTDRAWRFDAVGSHPPASEICDGEVTSGSLAASMESPREPVTNRSTVGSFIHKCYGAMQTLARAKFRGVAMDSSPFEAALAEFISIIDAADNPHVLQAALVRFAQRMVPASRIELLAGPTPTAHGPDEAATGPGSAGRRRPSRSSVKVQVDRLILDVPLRCGRALHGRLRIRPRARGAASFRTETIRKLTTLCSLSACALERLEHDQRWPERDPIAASRSAGRIPLYHFSQCRPMPHL